MKSIWILAGLVAVGTAFGQSEQWLTYHTRNEGRAYHLINLTTNRPPGVALPKFNSPPYFGRWRTPMDPSGGRWLCLDRTGKSGPYDRLYVDSNGDGRLDDKKPIHARVDLNNGYFPATPVVFKGEDGPITYHLAFRFYQYGKSMPRLLVSSAGWYEGTVNFAGVKKRIQLIDGNVNGTFNDMAPNPYESDRVVVEGDKAGQRFLGHLLEVDGQFFRFEVSRDGAFVKVQKAEHVTLGAVQVPDDISQFAAFGTNGYFVRTPAKGKFTLPAGTYHIFHWSIKRKDRQGTEWTLSGYDFPKSATFEVAADKPAGLQIGEPVRAALSAKGQAHRRVLFSLRFEGRQKESIEMLRNGQRPRGPKLKLVNADGSLCDTRTFEFG